MQCWEKQPHTPNPVVETKRVYDLEHWRTVGNGDSTPRDHGHRIACSLSQHRESRLQSVWCAGQHLETMPSIGWASQPTELQTGHSPQPIPPTHTHTYTHTGTQREVNLLTLPHLHVTPAQAKAITAGPWDLDELCDRSATGRLIW